MNFTMPCHDCNDPGKHENCVEDCASWREHMKEHTRLFFAEVVKGPMSMRLEEETKFAEY